MKATTAFATLVSAAAAASCVSTTPPVTGPKTYPTTVVGGVEVINTPLVQEARALVKKIFPNYLYKHVMRCWLFGASQIQTNATLRSMVDVEAHAMATILHDMGWDQTPGNPYVTPDNRFEVDGLNGAANIIKASPNGKDFDWWRLEQVMNGIRLHGNFYLQVSTPPTVQLIVNSIQLDNPFVTYPIANETLKAIFTEFPDTDIAAGANQTFTWLAETKPLYTYGTIEEQFGIEYVPGYSPVGHRAYDFIVNAIETNYSHWAIYAE
ncbi:hypothetical protein F5Y16DRAFT_396754 [Xylariaceae sp. FL0255]|nr:hypothetical protein F5Y16DRAFT_396754 [Xylariaceae sp. FL0255]